MVAYTLEQAFISFTGWLNQIEREACTISVAKYIMLSILFRFWGKGKRFSETCEWEPNRNCKQMKLFVSLDANADGKISLDELLAGREKLGKNLTREQTIRLFQDCDTSGDGYIDAAEFLVHLKNQRYSGKNSAQRYKRIIILTIRSLLIASLSWIYPSYPFIGLAGRRRRYWKEFGRC